MRFLPIPILVFALVSCAKDPSPTPPGGTEIPFEVVVQNDISELAARHAAWLSDASGKVLDFRWLHGNDSTHLIFKHFHAGDSLLDLIIARMTTVVGSGSTDTTLLVKTYTGVANGEQVRLRDPEFRQTTLLHIQFTNITSLDTIIVPDGLPYARPGWWNNFSGLYSVQHTGQIWLRFQLNGDPHWKYLKFESVSGSDLNVVLDQPALLPTEDHPHTIQLPFVANWKYRVDGVRDAAKLQFTALGDLNRPPGGALPQFDVLDVYPPITFDPLSFWPFTGYRVALSGTNTDGSTYIFDQMLDSLPVLLPKANYAVQPINTPDDRRANVQTTADFETLVLVRSHAGQPNLTWEAYLPVTLNAGYRLPDVPSELGAIFPDLANYNFGKQVRARAEDYQNLGSYRAVLDKIFRNDDVLWQANGRLLAKEKGL